MNIFERFFCCTLSRCSYLISDQSVSPVPAAGFSSWRTNNTVCSVHTKLSKPYTGYCDDRYQNMLTIAAYCYDRSTCCVAAYKTRFSEKVKSMLMFRLAPTVFSLLRQHGEGCLKESVAVSNYLGRLECINSGFQYDGIRYSPVAILNRAVIRNTRKDGGPSSMLAAL
jgi:hypothetical protein